MSLFGGNPIFAFGIAIRSQESRGFHHEGEIPDLSLPPDGIRVKLKLIKKDISDPMGFDRLILKAGGFPSENEAKQYGIRIRDSIYLSGLLSKNAYKLISFNIFEEGVLYLRASGNLSSPILLSSFEDNLNKAVNLLDKLDHKQSLALEFYNLSFFESDKRAAYISLFIAVEILVKIGKRQLSDKRERCLTKLEKMISKSDLCREDKNFFKSYLSNIKQESNKEACNRVIMENLDLDRAKIFESHQKIRNALLHNGEPPDNFDEKLNELRAIVSSLLSKILNLSD